MWIIGITGMIAGGKSTAAQLLAGFGAVHVNADAIAGEVTTRSSVIDQIANRLGDDLIGEDGALNRPAVAATVFGDDSISRSRLNTLEQIIHPLVRVEIVAAVRQAETSDSVAVCLDVPLLIRSGWSRGCDDIVFVGCDTVHQRRRIAQRGWTATQLQLRSRRQAPLDQKRHQSSFQIDTSEPHDWKGLLVDWYEKRRKRLPSRSTACQIDCSR